MFDNEPEGPDLELFLPDVGRSVSRWTSYSFNSHFLTPSDGFQLVAEGAGLDPIFEDGLVTGAKVQLRFEGCTQATGYIDAVDRDADRASGVVWAFEGRDVLGQVVDAGIDPRTQFKNTETLSDLLLRVFEPFGFDAEKLFVIDPSADAQIKTGRPAKRRKGESLKSKRLNQLRPNPGEGALDFAARVAKRFGLVIWPGADGETIVVAKPTFDQEPTYRLIRRRSQSQANNILSGRARFELSEQPSVIVADGFSGGGVFGKSKIKCLMVNPAVISDTAGIEKIAAAHKSAKLVLATDEAGKYLAFAPQRSPHAKPLYLHDENSKTLEQLEAFTRREMMARVRKTLTYTATVRGHSQVGDDGSAIPWAVDTVVDVQDEMTGVVEPMWILSRTFSKSRTQGTTTQLELIRLYTLEL